ncbi:MAG: U32 family peptidase, partial [Lachnospiraceae bacterium]|nr:U32 family peptidase [Lachnospiraceae bacterium]
DAVPFLRSLGIKRIVPARELSFSEIRALADTGIELECFIHGALCYSYSGQCLFSSMAGGRSGNRGRCAQPCRMKYRVEDGNGRVLTSPDEGYVLSLKDLNTLKLLPELLDAGIYALKIEGRMKKAEYAAGVTSIYRKYLDADLKDHRVDPVDEQRLFDLFNRQGFTEGFYTQQNGRHMLTFKEPAFREHDDEFIEEIREKYIRNSHRTPISGVYRFSEGQPYRLDVRIVLDGHDETVTVLSDDGVVAERAGKRAASKEDVEKQLSKLGDTDFIWDCLDGTVEGDLFLPVSLLNAFRRKAAEEVKARILSWYERTVPDGGYAAQEETAEHPVKANGAFGVSGTENTAPEFAVSVMNEAQLEMALKSRIVRRVDLQSTAAEAAAYSKTVQRIHEAGKQAYLRFPQVFRDRASAYMEVHAEDIRAARFDGFVIGSLEELGFLQRLRLQGRIISDAALYAFNSLAVRTLLEAGIERVTVPVELNRHEIAAAGAYEGQEMTVYGLVPMMVSASCLHKTLTGCRKQEEVWTLIDRMENRMPVVNSCRYCMNTIYNAHPTCLLDDLDEVLRFRPSVLKLDLTTESREEAEAVLNAFEARDLSLLPDGVSYTHGHFRRGVQ